MPAKKDLIGQRFGRLVVQYEAEPYYTSGGNRKVKWHCLCDCGKELNVSSGELLQGKTLSCGCYNREVNSERMKKMMYKRNRYDLSGSFGIGYDSKGNEFWFDLEDYDKIKDYCWTIHHTKYVTAKNKEHKWIMLHKLIMNDLDNKYCIDHIKTERKFDNRKSNLRHSSRSQNNMNKVMQKNNKSGHTGVYYHSYNDKWRAIININKKTKTLGDFKNIEDAIKARKEAEQKYYGDFCYAKSQEIANKLEEII